MPMWTRHLLAFVVFGALVLFIVVYVNGHQTPLTASPAPANKQQQAAEDRTEAENVSAEQAPHVVALGSGTIAAVRKAVSGYVQGQADQGSIKGPVQRTRCRALAGGRYTCTVSAGNLNYRFAARTGTSHLTYCPVVTPPYPVRPIPVSKRCR